MKYHPRAGTKTTRQRSHKSLLWCLLSALQDVVSYMAAKMQATWAQQNTMYHCIQNSGCSTRLCKTRKHLLNCEKCDLLKFQNQFWSSSWWRKSQDSFRLPPLIEIHIVLLWIALIIDRGRAWESTTISPVLYHLNILMPWLQALRVSKVTTNKCNVTHGLLPRFSFKNLKILKEAKFAVFHYIK